MAGFLNIAPRNNKQKDANVMKKVRSAKVVNGVTVRAAGGGMSERIALIRSMVEKAFPDKDKYAIINTYDDLGRYIDRVIEEGICSLDTETNGLDPILNTMAGSSLYTEGQKAIYIPSHHLSYVTTLPVADQISDEVLKEQFDRLVHKDVKMIMHNAQFDIRVVMNQINTDFRYNIYWDTQVAAHMLNENGQHGLKYLYSTWCDKGTGGKKDYSSLFDGMPFTLIPIRDGYLYAAKDALMTWEVFKFQEQYLDASFPLCRERGLERVAKLYREVEIPLIPVVVDMEQAGVTIDCDYAKELSVEYNQLLVEKQADFAKVCLMYKDEIEDYKNENPNHGLNSPINAGSPKQIATLLYDILKLKCPNKKKGKERSTKEEDLEQIENPIAKAIVKCRKLKKLLGTYIDAIPDKVNPKTDKLHASFNQNGTTTGRFSSSGPNLQNIPSKDKKIRKMFKPSVGCYLISGDLKQQEPKILGEMSGDDNLKAVGMEDVYAYIGSIVYKVPIDKCKEKNADGTSNPEGKRRRDIMKGIVLGLMYGKEAPATAKTLGMTLKEAQDIIAQFFDAFPQVKVWTDQLLATASETGYVETIWGRKRRLPELTLPKYEITYLEGKNKDFDPTFDEDDEDDNEEYTNEVPDDIANEYWDALESSNGWKQTMRVKERAKSEGIVIKENFKKISDAARQAMNSPIQGSAGDMVKNAMVCIGNPIYQETIAKISEGFRYCQEINALSREFEALGGKLLIQVHDELIGEAPIPVAYKCAKLMEKILIKSAAQMMSLPMSVDLEINSRWYGENLYDKLHKEQLELEKKES